MVKALVEIQDRIEPLVAEWERLAQHTKASPFLWPGWINAWWHAFGTGQLRILTVYENGRLTGVLPLRWFRGALSSITNPHTPLYGFLAANETAAKQMSQAMFYQNPRHIGLSYLSPTDPCVSLARAAADDARYQVLAESIQAAPYVDVDGTTWEVYEKGLGKNLRKDLRRRRRRLDEEGHLTLEIFEGKERLDELLEEGFRVEGSGWKGVYGTSISARPATRRFYTEVAHWAAERDWLRLAFLRLNGRSLAFDYCLEYNRIHYALKTGYDPDYERFSPGKVLRHLMLARAFSEGLATYDFLGVSDTWKEKWSNTNRELLFLHMFAPTALGFLDRTVFISGRSAFEGAKSVARSSALGERGRRLLKRVHATASARLGR